MSRVINLKKYELKKLGYSDFEHWINSSDDHVYIGRNMSHYVPGAVGSKWANPFKGDHFTKDERLRRYEMHIRNNQELMASLPELKGKTLGCWCHPEGCHGDILMKLVKEYVP